MCVFVSKEPFSPRQIICPLPESCKQVIASVATSLVVLRWMCDSPRMGCAWRTTPYIYVARTSNNSDHGMWTLLLLAATVRSFAHMLLGISDGNTRNVVWLWIRYMQKSFVLYCGVNLELIIRTLGHWGDSLNFSDKIGFIWKWWLCKWRSYIAISMWLCNNAYKVCL